MRFSKQEYWSGLPFPSSGDLPYPGIKPASLESPALAGGFFTANATGKPNLNKPIKKQKQKPTLWKNKTNRKTAYHEISTALNVLQNSISFLRSHFADGETEASNV